MAVYEPVLGRNLEHVHTAIPSNGTSIDVASASPPSPGQVLTATDSKHAIWLPPSGSGGGTASWGNITGTLSNQTDLQTALNGKENSLGYTPEDVANKSTNTSLGTSNTLYPTQNAVKTYVDTSIAASTGWTKVHKTYVDFSVASIHSKINLMALPANTVVEDIIIFINDDFDDGGGNTAGLSQMGIDVFSDSCLCYIGDANIRFGGGQGVTSQIKNGPAQLTPDSINSGNNDIGQVYSLMSQIDSNIQLKYHGPFLFSLTTSGNINITLYGQVNFNTFIAGDINVYIKTATLP